MSENFILDSFFGDDEDLLNLHRNIIRDECASRGIDYNEFDLDVMYAVMLGSSWLPNEETNDSSYDDKKDDEEYESIIDLFDDEYDPYWEYDVGGPKYKSHLRPEEKYGSPFHPLFNTPTVQAYNNRLNEELRKKEKIERKSFDIKGTIKKVLPKEKPEIHLKTPKFVGKLPTIHIRKLKINRGKGK